MLPSGCGVDIQAQRGCQGKAPAGGTPGPSAEFQQLWFTGNLAFGGCFPVKKFFKKITSHNCFGIKANMIHSGILFIFAFTYLTCDFKRLKHSCELLKGSWAPGHCACWTSRMNQLCPVLSVTSTKYGPPDKGFSWVGGGGK